MKQVLQALQRVLLAVLALKHAAGVGGVGRIAADKGARLSVLFDKTLAAGDLPRILVAALGLADSLTLPLAAAEATECSLASVAAERLCVGAEALTHASR